MPGLLAHGPHELTVCCSKALRLWGALDLPHSTLPLHRAHPAAGVCALVYVPFCRAQLSLAKEFQPPFLEQSQSEGILGFFLIGGREAGDPGTINCLSERRLPGSMWSPPAL